MSAFFDLHTQRNILRNLEQLFSYSSLALVGTTQLSKVVVSAQTISTTSAMSIRPTVSTCEKCKSTVIYYGYQPKFSGGTDSLSSGNKCIGCNKIVPKGEHHTTIYTQ